MGSAILDISTTISPSNASGLLADIPFFDNIFLAHADTLVLPNNGILYGDQMNFSNWATLGMPIGSAPAAVRWTLITGYEYILYYDSKRFVVYDQNQFIVHIVNGVSSAADMGVDFAVLNSHQFQIRMGAFSGATSFYAIGLWQNNPGTGIPEILERGIQNIVKPNSLPVPLASPVLIAIGDSCTAGYPYTASKPADSADVYSWTNVLRQTYGNLTVHNMGISGETTAQVLARFNADVVSASPDSVIISVGVNDNWPVTSTPLSYSQTTIITIGDSATAGVPYTGVKPSDLADIYAWSHVIRDNLDGIIVHNMGWEGNHSGDVLARFNTDVIAQAPTHCIISVGANDAWDMVKPVSSAVTATFNNIKDMFDLCINNGITPIYSSYLPTSYDFMVRLCNVSNGRILGTLEPDVIKYGPEFFSLLRSTLIDYCKANDILFIDTFNGVFMEGGIFHDNLLSDAVHPNIDGYNAEGEFILQHLLGILKPDNGFNNTDIDNAVRGAYQNIMEMYAQCVSAGIMPIYSSYLPTDRRQLAAIRTASGSKADFDIRAERFLVHLKSLIRNHCASNNLLFLETDSVISPDDSLKTNLLETDMLHPNQDGYIAMGKYVAANIRAWIDGQETVSFMPMWLGMCDWYEFFTYRLSLMMPPDLSSVIASDYDFWYNVWKGTIPCNLFYMDTEDRGTMAMLVWEDKYGVKQEAHFDIPKFTKSLYPALQPIQRPDQIVNNRPVYEPWLITNNAFTKSFDYIQVHYTEDYDDDAMRRQVADLMPDWE